MTMIGNTLLDKIIRVWHITSPAEILDRLHAEIKIVLRQDETNSVNGMDAVVLTLEKPEEQEGNIKVTFAGAKNPLYYFSPNSSTLTEVSGDRKSIGGIQDESKRFTNHTLNLAKRSVLYLGSDGLKDQNDVRRKKLGKKRLIELLTEIKALPLDEQKQKIEQQLDKHMLETTQRDDILWIGLRL